MMHRYGACIIALLAGCGSGGGGPVAFVPTPTPPAGLGTGPSDCTKGDFGSAHNVAINEASGFAYAVGISSGVTTCA